MKENRQESTVIKYHRGYKYQLSRDAWFKTDIRWHDVSTKYTRLYADGWLHIKTGYAWDGASGPTIDTKSSMGGSLVHDALYQLIRLELIPRNSRLTADKKLKKRCITDGMWKWRAATWYRFLRRYAAHAAHPDHKRKEYTAP